MLLNVAAHKVSIRNVKVSKCERHIMYSVTKRTASQNVMCTLCKVHFMFVKVYILWRCTLFDVYVLKTLCFGTLTLCCVQLRFVTLRHVTSTLCCFTLCSNIDKRVWMPIGSPHKTIGICECTLFVFQGFDIIQSPRISCVIFWHLRSAPYLLQTELLRIKIPRLNPRFFVHNFIL